MMATSSQRGIEHLYKYLSTVLQSGALRDMPELAETVRVALISSDLDLVTDVSELVRVQDLDFSQEKQDEQPQKEPLFREPAPEQLHGQVFIGRTVHGGYDVMLPRRAFGQHAHLGLFGASGTGKSALLNLISVQLMLQGVTAIVLDVLDQSAPLLVPHVPADRLSVVDYSDYRRNPLLGPPGMSQMEWIRRATAHLIESLDMTPVTANYLVNTCESIIAAGTIATIPRVIACAEREQARSQSARALLNRLLPLVMCGERVFACETGFDIRKLLSRSCILSLKQCPPGIRNLLSNDLYFYMAATMPVLEKWQLNAVFVFHEAGPLLRAADQFFVRMICEARNYGIGFCFADQVPQLEAPAIRSNIGTKLLLRLEDPASLEGFRVGMSLGEQQRNFILNMPDRMMLVRRPDVNHPFLVRVPNLF